MGDLRSSHLIFSTALRPAAPYPTTTKGTDLLVACVRDPADLEGAACRVESQRDECNDESREEEVTAASRKLQDRLLILEVNIYFVSWHGVAGIKSNQSH